MLEIAIFGCEFKRIQADKPHSNLGIENCHHQSNHPLVRSSISIIIVDMTIIINVDTKEHENA
jgi:hypothetical protein